MDQRKQFQIVDLFLFSVMAVLSRVLSDVYLTQLNTSFYYSLQTSVCLIALIRWGKWGVIPLFISSMSSILVQEISMYNGLVYYVFGDLWLALPILIWGSRQRDYWVANWKRTLGYVLISHIALSLGKGISIFWLTGEVTGMMDFFASNLMVMVMDGIVLLVMGTLRGLMVDIENLMRREGTADGETDG